MWAHFVFASTGPLAHECAVTGCNSRMASSSSTAVYVAPLAYQDVYASIRASNMGQTDWHFDG